MSTIELTNKIREIKELQQLQKEAEAEIETIKDQIKAHMTAVKTDTLPVDVFTIRWKEQTSNRFDTPRFKADHADMYTAYLKTSKSRPFNID